MIFNVAQLMKEPVGTGASYSADFHEEQVQLDESLKISGPIDGHVRMRRVNQGLLVDGWVDLTLELQCTRCLKDFEQPMHVTFEERFYPTVDVMTGAPVPPSDEDDVFLLDDHHQVDLTEAIRQATLLAIPMVTLCKEDCAGLCPRCGHDLNLGPCDCEPEVDTRLNVLKALLENGSQPS
jgi:Predicted metal-binding, possibly nucleic acid-binding protein